MLRPPRRDHVPTLADARRERRVDDRYDVSIDTRLKNSKGLAIKGTMKDLSESGCRIKVTSGNRPEVDEVYALKFGALEAQMGWTIWSEEGAAGFRFSHPLSRYVVAHLASNGGAKPGDACA